MENAIQWIAVFSGGIVFGVLLLLVIMHFLLRWQENEELLNERMNFDELVTDDEG